MSSTIGNLYIPTWFSYAKDPQELCDLIQRFKLAQEKPDRECRDEVYILTKRLLLNKENADAERESKRIMVLSKAINFYCKNFPAFNDILSPASRDIFFSYVLRFRKTRNLEVIRSVVTSESTCLYAQNIPVLFRTIPHHYLSSTLYAFKNVSLHPCFVSEDMGRKMMGSLTISDIIQLLFGVEWALFSDIVLPVFEDKHIIETIKFFEVCVSVLLHMENSAVVANQEMDSIYTCQLGNKHGAGVEHVCNHRFRFTMDTIISHTFLEIFQSMGRVQIVPVSNLYRKVLEKIHSAISVFDKTSIVASLVEHVEKLICTESHVRIYQQHVSGISQPTVQTVLLNKNDELYPATGICHMEILRCLIAGTGMYFCKHHHILDSMFELFSYSFSSGDEENPVKLMLQGEIPMMKYNRLRRQWEFTFNTIIYAHSSLTNLYIFICQTLSEFKYMGSVDARIIYNKLLEEDVPFIND